MITLGVIPVNIPMPIHSGNGGGISFEECEQVYKITAVVTLVAIIVLLLQLCYYYLTYKSDPFNKRLYGCFLKYFMDKMEWNVLSVLTGMITIIFLLFSLGTFLYGILFM